MSEQTDSGKVVERILNLAEDEVQQIAAHVQTIDNCLRGDLEKGTKGIVERLNAVEHNCRQNHGSGQRLQQLAEQVDTNRMEAPARPAWNPKDIILAVATAIAIVIGAIATATSQCNRRDIRRDNSRWHRSGQVAPDDSAGP